MMPKYYQIFLICILILAPGCGRETPKRVYQEIVIESPLKTSVPMSSGNIPDGLLESLADVPLIWQKPESWQEYPGSGFRLVTFNAGEGGDAIECTIVSLSGAAGGIEANLIRWMQQINLNVPAGTPVLEYLKKNEAYMPGYATAGGWLINFIEFAKLQKNVAPDAPSMQVSIITSPDKSMDSTIFVKMTGTIDALSKHKDEFQFLSNSIKLK